MSRCSPRLPGDTCGMREWKCQAQTRGTVVVHSCMETIPDCQVVAPSRSVPASTRGRGKENGGPADAAVSTPARPLQPHNFTTLLPAAMPAGTE